MWIINDPGMLWALDTPMAIPHQEDLRYKKINNNTIMTIVKLECPLFLISKQGSATIKWENVK